MYGSIVGVITSRCTSRSPWIIYKNQMKKNPGNGSSVPTLSIIPGWDAIARPQEGDSVEDGHFTVRRCWRTGLRSFLLVFLNFWNVVWEIRMSWSWICWINMNLRHHLISHVPFIIPQYIPVELYEHKGMTKGEPGEMTSAPRIRCKDSLWAWLTADCYPPITKLKFEEKTLFAGIVSSLVLLCSVS